MHNRARLVTASFLTKHLYLDWRLGAAALLRPPASTETSRATSATGSGSRERARTRGRIASSTRSRQARRFDPDGDVRPPLRPRARPAIEGGAVHEPWKLGRLSAGDYPEPIVDHAEAVARFRRARQTSAALRLEARRRVRSARATAAARSRRGRAARAPRITSHETSICQRRRPCRADDGNAWWLLCQPSPRTSTAISQLLRDSSRERKSRRPNMWQIEFTAKVACW